MKKIHVSSPIVEIDGDEMARVIWQKIRNELILPFIDLQIIHFDLSIQNRDLTGDKVSHDAGYAIKENGVGIKCATITPDEARVKEFNLKAMYPSPNGTIRNIIGGTVFRSPIVCKNVPKLINNWRLPITIGRHAFGDQYKASEIEISEPGTLKMVFIPDSNASNTMEIEVFKFQGSGIGMSMYNLKESIASFARSSFNHALTLGYPMYLSTKNTILKKYDGLFLHVFAEIFEKEFDSRFKEAGLTYEHKLIDDMVAFAMKSDGGFLWACKNYDGDVQSDFVAQGFGSLGLMTSVLVSPDGRVIEAEAAHGTITRHYREHQKGKETSTNPVALIFSWTQGLSYRAKFDVNPELANFCKKLESTCISVIESGRVTKDLALLMGGTDWLTTNEFLNEVKSDLILSLQK